MSERLSWAICRRALAIMPLGLIILNASHASEKVEYEYDALGRLVAACYVGQSALIDLHYDPAGNRSEVSTSSESCGATEFWIDDAPPVEEGGVLSFPVRRTGANAQTHTINYATSNGGALAGSDYSAVSGVLTFTSGQLEKIVMVNTTDDAIHEGDETVLISLSSPSGETAIIRGEASGTILDNDPGSGFALSGASVSEGGSLVFAVTRTGTTSLSHSVSYATSNGTATSGSDYTAASGALTFLPTDVQKDIIISTLPDSVYENDETLLVTLSNPTNGATISIPQATGTIVDDDAAPTFSISPASVTAGGVLSFAVTKSGTTALSHSIDYATANGTAVAGVHYTLKTGSISFSSGQTEKFVSVNTTSGGIPVGGASKELTVNLSNPTSGATLSTAQGLGTISAPPNNAPVAVNDSISGTYYPYDSVPAYVRANDTDPDGHSLTITSASCLSAGCSVSVIGGDYLLVTGTTPGIKTVRYWISDGYGGSANADVIVGDFWEIEMCGDYPC